ncbi:MAG TPA: hypothetical protein VM146_03585 [Steroidobacteraceae bacterium]|nr:hypothetical protein [Steroidobacteraceae bacterium]
MTTATDEGVATPSIGAGAGGLGWLGGLFPPGGGVDDELPPPPHPARANNTKQQDAKKNWRMNENPPDEMKGSRQAVANPPSRRIGGASRRLEGFDLEAGHGSRGRAGLMTGV